MARFKPIYIRRSDGKSAVISRGGHREPNEPLPDQLDTTPDRHGVADFYREVGPEDAKSLDWRRKLGGMLARELGLGERSGEHSYMLVAFPEHYRLYEHVKKTERDGQTEIKSKTHAGGGNDRQDAYLYGHPVGRRKRFRSPVEFFPHLLWLGTNESADPDNCSCKICSPEDLEAVIPGAKIRPERPIKQVSDMPKVSSSMPRQAVTQSGKPPPMARSNSNPRLPTATPLPTARNTDQERDRQYYNFMYRPGELVWFKRGQAWGLGTVVRRWLGNGNMTSEYNYLVQPLSYPGHNQPISVKTGDTEFRPWLAWSVPKFTHDGLNNLPQPAQYHTADWQGIAKKRYGPGELEVDASILAAKAVDATYTPCERITSSQPEPGVTETSYNALYLGAEHIWVGDPIRLQTSSGTDIMIVHAIIERLRPQGTPSTTVLGDIYRLTTIPHPPGSTNPLITAPNPALPERLTTDLRHRNTTSIPARNSATYWSLRTPAARISLKEIKGRWYEASLLLPILQGVAQYESLARKGEVQEATLWMNSRGDCWNANKPLISSTTDQAARAAMSAHLSRRAERVVAFGRAVPPGTEIKFGLERPVVAQQSQVNSAATGGGGEVLLIDPKFESAEDDAVAVQVGETGVGVNGLEEFMILDEPDMPGFGQEYNNNNSGQSTQEGYY
ncbi:hypothetical protein LTR62_007619 [Meristemomyces frigidus]|uniref:Cryptic loci regulator 2 N-terminal domain-containing protein n=1 Tax=Meristemomyces frigidus TaxID=1508187 RepID=A0AAN7TBM4_9PEZI|nr:hypothetical protein LTR62_007619 [Meristemomyces frigidus]